MCCVELLRLNIGNHGIYLPINYYKEANDIKYFSSTNYDTFQSCLTKVKSMVFELQPSY